MGNLMKTECPRCGRPVMTVRKSITGADDLKRKFEGVCSRCITPQEEYEILHGQARSFIKQ